MFFLLAEQLNPAGLTSNNELPPPSSQLRMLQAACHLAAEKSDGVPPLSTQLRKPQANHLASGTKRKLASEPSIESIEGFDDWDDSLLSFANDTAMLVDELQGTFEDTPVTTKEPEPMVVKKKALRTTSSVLFFFPQTYQITYILSQTTVTTTDSKVPPAKKIKTEQKVKTEHKVKTEQTDVSNTALASTPAVADGPWVEVLKAQSAYRDTDLPPTCQDGRWPKAYLPTIFLWAGSQPSLWNISDGAFLEAIQHVFKAIYPEVEYTPTLQGSVFGVVCSSTVQSSPSHIFNFIRPINVSLSGAAILALPQLPSSSIL